MTAMQPWASSGDILRRREGLSIFDNATKPLAWTIGRPVRPRLVRKLALRDEVGDPLHPMFTDLPTGAWSMPP